MEMKKSGPVRKIKSVFLPALIVVLAFIANRTLSKGYPLYYIIPNFLLYTPFRGATNFFWSIMDPQEKLTAPREHKLLPEITKEEFSMEALEKCTQGFKHPCVVRGLFLDTPAVNHWKKKAYLNERLGHFTVPYIANNIYGGKRKDSFEYDTFQNIHNEIIDKSDSKKYLFFPIVSRTIEGDKKRSEERSSLALKTNEIIHDDLLLSQKIWDGFGTNQTLHKNFYGTQVIIGRGLKNSEKSTGTGWHTEGGNNWFILIEGRKRWYSMAPGDSSLMKPIRGGPSHFAAGSIVTPETLQRLPILYADLEKGDMLYNPDWWWHKITNYEGLAIACAIREVHLSRSVRNNLQFTSIVAASRISNAIGLDIGGYANPRR